MEGMFQYARRFDQDISRWNVAQVMSMQSMFSHASSFNSPLDSWDVGRVTSLASIFEEAEMFNQPLGNWNTGQVADMHSSFKGASSFDNNIESWSTANVADMQRMFESAFVFNQPLDGWNVGNVRNMRRMFKNAFAFNQTLENWDVSQVTDMSNMFAFAISFNKPIGRWDTSGVITMEGMFSFAHEFQQDITLWNTVQVTDMSSMFDSAVSFNQDLSSWCVVGNILPPKGFDEDAIRWTLPRPYWGSCPPLPREPSPHFRIASNGVTIQCGLAPVRSWSIINGVMFTKRSLSMITASNAMTSCTSGIADMGGMFLNHVEFNGNISTWDVSLVQNMSAMFRGASSFNQDIKHWDTSRVFFMTRMFQDVSSFNRDLSKWCVSRLDSMPTLFDAGAISWQLPRPVWGECPSEKATNAPLDLGLVLGLVIPLGILLCLVATGLLWIWHKKNIEATKMRLKRSNVPGTVTSASMRKLMQLPLMGPLKVTVVMTDIKNSTGLWELEAEAMMTATKLHHDLLRTLLHQFGGYEAANEGDGFILGFHTPFDALCFTLVFQEELLHLDWPPEVQRMTESCEIDQKERCCFSGLRVRSSIATGLPERFQTNPITNQVEYIGGVMETAKLLDSLCDGGQILMDELSFLLVHGQKNGLEELKSTAKMYDMDRKPYFAVLPCYNRPSARTMQRSTAHILFNGGPPIFLDCGAYLFNTTTLSCTHGEQASSRPFRHAGVVNTYQVLSQKLAERALCFQMPAENSQTRGGYFTAPCVMAAFQFEHSHSSALRSVRPKSNMLKADSTTDIKLKNILAPTTIIFCELHLHCNAYKTPSVWQQKIKGYYTSMVQNLVRSYHGYECQLIDQTFLLAFHSAQSALQWSVELHAQISMFCQKLESENRLGEGRPLGSDVCLSEQEGREFIGLTTPADHSVRKLPFDVSIGLFEGVPTSVTPNTKTGRADYFGPLLSRAARLQHSCPSGAIFGPLELLQDVLKLYNNQISDKMDELDVHLYSVCKFLYKGIDECIEVGSVVVHLPLDVSLLSKDHAKARIFEKGSGLVASMHASFAEKAVIGNHLP